MSIKTKNCSGTGISSDLATPLRERLRSDLDPSEGAGAPKSTRFSAPDTLSVGRRRTGAQLFPSAWLRQTGGGVNVIRS
jgi:hypothetical protein